MRMRTLRLAVAVAALMAGIATQAQAQMCFRGKPLPHCKYFWVTEFTYGNHVDGNLSTGQMFMPELGLLVNLDEKNAIGGSVFFRVLVDSRHPDGLGAGFKGRYRRWINKDFNIDVAPGFTFLDETEFATDVTVNFRDWIGLGARVEFWRAEFNQTNTAVYSLVKVGGIPGISLSSVTIGVLAFLVVIFIGAG